VSAPAQELESEVGRLVLRLLNLPQVPDMGLVRADVPEWDSLKHMEIVFALEDRYNVRFDESEFAALTTPATIAASLRKHLAA